MRESFIAQRLPSAAERHDRQPGERSVLLRSLLMTLSCLNHGRRLPRPISASRSELRHRRSRDAPTPCGPTTRRTDTGWSGDSTGLPTKMISKKRLEIYSPWHMSRSDPFWPQSHRAHPLTPVSPPMPLTNHFSVNANRASRGTTTIALAAITKPQFVP